MPILKSIRTSIALFEQGFRPIGKADAKYFTAIGRLIVTFSAEVDAELNSSLRAAITTDELELPSLLVGEMRGGEAIAHLRRIIAARKVEPGTAKEIEQLFSEIEPLRHVRDIVAHRLCDVKGSKLAFHNATLARTEASLMVDIYTLKELADFTRYAKRLGYRIERAFAKVSGEPVTPRQKASFLLRRHTLIQNIISARCKDGTIKGEVAVRLKALNQVASQALQTYADAVKAIDPLLYDKERRCEQAVDSLSAEMAAKDLPRGEALLEIPARLRKPDRSARAYTHRSRERQRPSSRG